jgi:alpha-ketoglutarate-dependent taurine dioxygenase
MQRGPISPTLTFGDVVTGLDLASPLDSATWAELDRAFHERGVLVFKGQGHLTVSEQRAFASHWGDMDGHGAIPILPLSNVRKSGAVLAEGTDAYLNLKGNEGFHIDNTYQPRAAKAGILRAVILPPGGSQTAFCDSWAAYDALDDGQRRRIEGLAAYHSGLYSQAKLGQDPTGATVDAPAPGGLYLARAYLRPLVKQHPVVHGRRGLTIGRHAFGVTAMADARPDDDDDDGDDDDNDADAGDGGGWERGRWLLLPPRESDELLAELLRFAASEPSRTYYHQWAVGDLVLWDNRRMLHRACPYPSHQRRVFMGNRIGGEASEAALNAAEAAPGRAQLGLELRRIAAAPGRFEAGERALRAHFDAHMPPPPPPPRERGERQARL